MTDGASPIPGSGRHSHCAFGRGAESRADPDSLLLDPEVEGRLTDDGVLEEVSGARLDRGSVLASGQCLIELMQVDREQIGSDQPKPLAILWQHVFPDRVAKAMERLPESVTRPGFLDPAPEQVHDLVTAHFASDGQQAEERKRFTPPEGLGRGALRVPERRRSKNLEVERSGGRGQRNPKRENGLHLRYIEDEAGNAR